MRYTSTSSDVDVVRGAKYGTSTSSLLVWRRCSSFGEKGSAKGLSSTALGDALDKMGIPARPTSRHAAYFFKSESIRNILLKTTVVYYVK